MSHDHIPSRPHVQGFSTPLRLRPSAQELTDGAGLLVLRRLWDRLRIGRWLDERASGLGGHFRASLMVELWIAVLWYGGGWLEDLRPLSRRGIRRLFGWARVPDPTTFGRWLRRAGGPLLPVLDRLIRRLVRIRWSWTGVPKAVTLVLDSTVSVRYGRKQAGAERGYNPKKPGRPSHHPLLAFLQETGDLAGILWRPGSAWAGARTEDWVPELVGWLREAGVQEITVRLDKGFWAKRIVRTLQKLEISFLLKVPNQQFVRDQLGTWRKSTRAEGIFPEAEMVWTNSGRLWGARLLSLEGRRPLDADAEGTLPLDTWEVTETAHVLTNLPGIHALTAWRRYNAGCVVEQRIEELGQLSVGQTAVDDLGGNRLLWALGGLAYQLLHLLRTRLSGSWRVAQPKRLRAWLFRLAGRFTTSGGRWRLDVPPAALEVGLLGRALRAIRGPPPRYSH
ncbi:MAG TPA: transposase [Longimicrobiales bacterium]|nr:transposase [Longimicrobiales bacterium]